MGVCETPLINKVCDAVGGLVSASGEAITNAVGAWIAQSMAELAGNSADLAARAVDATTRGDLNAAWFRDNYEMLLPIGLVLIVATFCAQLVRAAVRRDEQALSQAVTGTVIGVAFQFGAIAFTSVALTVVDALSAGVWSAGGTSVDAAVRRVIQVTTFGAMFPLGWAVVALIAFVCAICMFIYWGVMVFRKVAILILVTLAVFAGAGGGWEAARRWRRGWVEATATLVVSKLLMTIVFVLGVTAMGRSDNSDGLAALSDAMAGIVVMCLVLCCPMVTFKFVHWAGETTNGQELMSAAGAGVTTAVGAAKTTRRRASAATSGAPQGPASVPGADSNGVVSGIPSPNGPAADSGTTPSSRTAPTNATRRSGANTRDAPESAPAALSTPTRDRSDNSQPSGNSNEPAQINQGSAASLAESPPPEVSPLPRPSNGESAPLAPQNQLNPAASAASSLAQRDAQAAALSAPVSVPTISPDGNTAHANWPGTNTNSPQNPVPRSLPTGSPPAPPRGS